MFTKLKQKKRILIILIYLLNNTKLRFYIFTSNRSKLINFNFYNYTDQIKYNKCYYNNRELVYVTRNKVILHETLSCLILHRV